MFTVGLDATSGVHASTTGVFCFAVVFLGAAFVGAVFLAGAVFLTAAFAFAGAAFLLGVLLGVFFCGAIGGQPIWWSRAE